MYREVFRKYDGRVRSSALDASFGSWMRVWCMRELAIDRPFSFSSKLLDI